MKAFLLLLLCLPVLGHATDYRAYQDWAKRSSDYCKRRAATTGLSRLNEQRAANNCLRDIALRYLRRNVTTLKEHGHDCEGNQVITNLDSQNMSYHLLLRNYENGHTLDMNTRRPQSISSTESTLVYYLANAASDYAKIMRQIRSE